MFLYMLKCIFKIIIVNYFAANVSGNLNYQVSTRSYPYLGTKLDGKMICKILNQIFFS